MKLTSFIWTLPMALIALMSTIVLTLQSCSVPVKVIDDTNYVQVKDLYTPIVVYGIILACGVAVSMFTLVKVNKLSRQLENKTGYIV